MHSSRLSATGGRSCAPAFTVAAFEDLLADVLGGGLDFLHFFADARTGSLVATDRLSDVLFRLGNQALERIVFGHDADPPMEPVFNVNRKGIRLMEGARS